MLGLKAGGLDVGLVIIGLKRRLALTSLWSDRGVSEVFISSKILSLLVRRRSRVLSFLVELRTSWEMRFTDMNWRSCSHCRVCSLVLVCWIVRSSQQILGKLKSPMMIMSW